MKYDLIDGHIKVTDDGGNVRWQGRPLDQPVRAVSPLPAGEGAIVLLDYMAVPNHYENLLRIGPDGDIVWQAPLPEPVGDRYVEFLWRDGGLIAHTWSGYMVEVDVASGRLTRTTFTK